MKFCKKIAVFLLCLILLPAQIAYADGSGNVDGGGGSLNHGKEGYNWPDIGYDGVRVTVVDAQSGQKVMCRHFQPMSATLEIPASWIIGAGRSCPLRLEITAIIIRSIRFRRLYQGTARKRVLRQSVRIFVQRRPR